jgi:galactokinase
MPTLNQIADRLRSDEGRLALSRLYGGAPQVLDEQTARYLNLLERFSATFPDHQHAELFSSPGRTEVGGNHTDHNAGRILAAAVDLDIIAAVARNNSDVIRVQSEGYPISVVKLSELAAVEGERYTATSLIRGVCSRFQQLGLATGGFDAVATSRVPKGSGLSSSAAYEVLISVITNTLFNQGKIGNVQLAQISQYAENQYFGKPCGLMDQTTCAVGGFVTIDFKDFIQPQVKKVDYDFSASGYSLVIVDTAGDHADLNDEYEALEHEMKSVARALGGQVLREFSEEEVINKLDFLRGKVSDRAILRAVHFYRDDRRVVEQVEALENNDFQRFLQLIIDSGESSWMLCQNCYSTKAIHKQGITIALTASEALLKGRGAWRMHGGGFAGTIQAFIPDDLLSIYIEKTERVFGKSSCHTVRIRPDGATHIEI